MKDKILDYLNQELSQQERVDFEKALAKDPILQQEFKFQQDKWIQLKTTHLKQIAQAKTKTWATGANALHQQQKIVQLRVIRFSTAFAAAACLALLFWIPKTPTKSPSHFEEPVAGATGNEASPHINPLDSLLRIPVKSLIPQSVFVQRIEISLKMLADENIKKLINLYYISSESVENINLDNSNLSDEATAIQWLLKAMYKFENNPQNKKGVANCLDRIPKNYFEIEKNLYQNAFSESVVQPIVQQSNNLHYEKAMLLSKKAGNKE